jgi:hypothetical protein
METPPAFCAGAVALAIGSAVTILISRLAIPGFEVQGYLPLIPGLISLLLWKHYAAAFRKSCLDDPAWKSALWYYHVNAVPLCVLVMALIAMAPWLNELIRRGYLPNMNPSTAFAAISGAVIILMAVGGYWTHRRVQNVLHPLQRAVAVKLAQEHLGRRYSVSRGIFRETGG